MGSLWVCTRTHVEVRVQLQAVAIFKQVLKTELMPLALYSKHHYPLSYFSPRPVI